LNTDLKQDFFCSLNTRIYYTALRGEGSSFAKAATDGRRKNVHRDTVLFLLALDKFPKYPP